MQLSVVTSILIGCFLCVLSRHVRKAPESTLTGIRILDGLCMNSRSDRLVYRFKRDNKVCIAFDTLKTGMVDVFTWQVVEAPSGTFISSHMKEEKVLALDFRKNVTRDDIIGATGKRHQRQFKFRMERKMKHCRKLTKKKKKHCKLSSIHTVFVRLQMKDVKFGTSPEDCDT